MKCLFQFISLHRTEYLSFNVTFVFTEGHSYFKVARIYFTSLPMEYFYSQFGRDSDDARDVSLYSPKIRTELIQLYVPGNLPFRTICLTPPPSSTPCFELTATPPTQKHILFFDKNISLIGDYINVNTWRSVFAAILTLPAKNNPVYSILLSKIAKIHAWNKLKSYKKVPISTQIFSAIKSNDQLLTGSQFLKRIMSTLIIYLLNQNFYANDVDIMEFEPCVLLPHATAWGDWE